MVAFAYPLIVMQCADTGGVESPYMVWWLFTSFYAASFFPVRRAYLNAAVVTILALVPAVYDDSFGQTDSNTMLLLLIALVWTLTSSIATSRELERGAERAARFTALADPLTGVANQRSIERTVDAATRGGQTQFGLVLVDMHGLKGANAAFGFAVGDAMLLRVASLMRYVCDSQAAGRANPRRGIRRLSARCRRAGGRAVAPTLRVGSSNAQHLGTQPPTPNIRDRGVGRLPNRWSSFVAVVRACRPTARRSAHH